MRIAGLRVRVRVRVCVRVSNGRMQYVMLYRARLGRARSGTCGRGFVRACSGVHGPKGGYAECGMCRLVRYTTPSACVCRVVHYATYSAHSAHLYYWYTFILHIQNV